MRDLGDAYVKDEFGRHKNAEPKFLGPFYQQVREPDAKIRCDAMPAHCFLAVA